MYFSPWYIVYLTGWSLLANLTELDHNKTTTELLSTGNLHFRKYSVVAHMVAL